MQGLSHHHRMAALGKTIALLSIVLTLTGCVSTRPFRDANGHVIAGSIATMETVPIGGIAQRLWFRGVNATNPVLLILHGGPGISEAVLFRHFNAELEQHFVVVNWEQRGTGRSFHADIPPDSMTIAQFLRDLDEVVELIKKRFHKETIILLGHSWGTALGTLYAQQHPEKVAAYVGTGQVANMPQGEQISYDFALTQAVARQNEKAIAALRAIGPPPHTVDEMLTSRTWVERFGGSFHGGLSTGKLIWTALRADEVDLYDLILFGRGNRFSLDHLWSEFSQLDLTADKAFTIPVFFLLGRYDWQIPAVLAASYFETLSAPYKQVVWFEASAHNPPFEEPQQFNAVLIHNVLPLATGAMNCARAVPSANKREGVPD